MTYRITRNDGTFYAAVPPNVILGPNNPTAQRAPINLIGRNKVSYGEAQNENFLWLVENFSGTDTPTAPVKGQLWYDTTNITGIVGDYGGGGELKLAVSDNAGATQWLTVPVISQTTNEPADSTPGRFIIHNKETLKVRMNNSWFTIMTEASEDRLYQGLLPEYEFDATGANNLRPAGDTIALFARGGYIYEDLDGNPALGGDTQGVLRYGGVYQWEATILAREVDTNNYKKWKMSGAFHINKEGEQSLLVSDPRYIEQMYVNPIEVSNQVGDSGDWTVEVRARQDPINTSLDVTTVAEGEYYGFEFIGNHGKTVSVPMKWSVYFTITGLV